MSPGPRRPLLAALLAALVAAFVYANALRNGFAYDDVAIIQADTTVHSLDHVPALFTRGYWARDAALALYRPLTSASFALDWVLGSGNPAFFHATNVAWHALATALATLLLATLFGTPAALAGGLLFAVHPVHVEAVSNVVGRADVMGGAAVFGAALAWLRVRRPGPRIAGVLALFGAGLLVKESVIGLPLLLPLLDLARGELRLRRAGAYLRSHAAAYVLLFAVAAAYLLMRLAVLGNVAPTRVDPTLEMAGGTTGRVLTALQAWPHVFRLLLFPRTLLADYGPRILLPAQSLTAPVLLGALLFGGLVGGGVLAAARGRGRTALLLLWVPVVLLPVSNLLVPIGIIVAERVLYTASFAVAAAAGVACAHLFAQGGARRAGALAGIALLLGAGAVRTWTRTPAWASTDTVMRTLLEDRPDSFRAQWHRARFWRLRAQPDSALRTYGRAIEVWPHRRNLVDEAATYASELGRLEPAYRLADFAVRRWPDDLVASRIAAAAALDRGDTAAARAHLANGLRHHPGDPLLQRMDRALNHVPGS